jgi:hypothetical protein
MLCMSFQERETRILQASRKALVVGAGILAIGASVGTLAVLDLINNSGADKQYPPQFQEQSEMEREEAISYRQNMLNNILPSDKVTMLKTPITRQIR